MLVARGVEAPVIRDTHDAIAAHTGEALSPEDAQPAQAIVDESHAVLERPLGTIRPGDEHEPDERARRLADALVAGDATAAPPPGRRRRGIHDPRPSRAAAGTRLPSG